MQETEVQSLGQKDPLEKGMAAHSSILAWRVPWTEEPGGLQSMGSQRVGHDWATNTFERYEPLLRSPLRGRFICGAYITEVVLWGNCLSSYLVEKFLLSLHGQVVCVHACVLSCFKLSCFSCVWLYATPWLCVRLFCPWGFSRREYWRGLPCLPPGDLPDPRIEPTLLMSPALSGRVFTTSTTWVAQPSSCISL